MRGERVHVRDAHFADRMICGRRDTGLRSVPIREGRTAGPLCLKCSHQLVSAELLETIRLGPHPGVQNLFEWGYD